MAKVNGPIGKPINRRKALKISQRILEKAERERIELEIARNKKLRNYYLDKTENYLSLKKSNNRK